MPRRSKSSKKAADTAAPERGAVAPDPRRERLLNCAAVVGPTLACFALYLYTLAPTVVEEDSSEFVAAIHVLGIPHPSGYPLYMLLGKLFETLLPIGGAAYRVNLLSAVCATAMVALLSLITLRLTGSRPAAVLAAAVSGLNQPAWSHAVIAEVYTLHGLLVVLVLFAFWRWHQARTWRAISWLCAVSGLGLAHHRTILFFAAPTILIAIVCQRPFRLRSLVKALAAGIAPLALYAYLPLRAMANSPLNWGNPRTWDNFWYHVMARTYSPLPFGRNLAGAAAEFGSFLREAARQISWLGIVAAAIGAVLLLRKKPLFGLGVALSLVGALIFNSTYGLPKQWQFHLPTFIVMALWLGTALAAALEWVARKWGRSATARRAANATAYAIAIALMPAMMTTSNYGRCNRRGQWEVESWARRTIAEVKPNAVLAARGDTPTFAIWYVQAVHGLRPDVTVEEPDRFSDPWYLPTVRIPSVRDAVIEVMERRWPDVPNPQPSFGLHAIYILAKHVPQHRPLYAYDVPRGLPPGVVALKHDPDMIEFARLHEPAASSFLVPRKEKAAGIELLPGLNMVRADVTPQRVRRLETYTVEFGWVCKKPISPGFSVGVRLHYIPMRGGGQQYVAPSSVQEAPLVYGLPLSATPPEFEYRHKATFVADYQTPPGTYALTAMVGKWDKAGQPMHPPQAEIPIAQMQILPARPGALTGAAPK